MFERIAIENDTEQSDSDEHLLPEKDEILRRVKFLKDLVQHIKKRIFIYYEYLIFSLAFKINFKCLKTR